VRPSRLATLIATAALTSCSRPRRKVACGIAVDDLRTLLHELALLEPPFTVFGGIAEDLLLYGELTRPHNDIDVLVLRDELPARVTTCERIGFTPMVPRYEPVPGRPLVCGGRRGALELELGVGDRNAEGSFFVTGTPDGQVVRVRLSEDPFTKQTVQFEGTAVHVVAPIILYEIRAGFALAGTFGAQGSKHELAQEQLRVAFFSDRDLASLAPHIEPAPFG
jgi:hypothetical protein